MFFLVFFHAKSYIFPVGTDAQHQGLFQDKFVRYNCQSILSAVPVKAASGVPLEINITIFRLMILLDTTVKTYKVCLLFWSCYWQ